MKVKYLSNLAAGILTMGVAGLTNAAVINYTATDLADVNPGDDLWQYSYSISDTSFAADTGFTIYFVPGLYDFLDPSPTAPNSDWDVLTWNPDPLLPGDGAYDAYALVGNASLADKFSINFVWLGAGVGTGLPGSQPFQVYDGISYSILEDGFTTPVATPVPEPATMLLFGTGLAGLVGSRIKTKLNRNRDNDLRGGRNE